MIKGITIKNGKIRLILVGEDSIDKDLLKALDGATLRLIKDNLRIAELSIAEGAILEMEASQPPIKE